MGVLRHFIDFDALGSPTLRNILDGAVDIKNARREVEKNDTKYSHLLDGRVLAMIFQRPSTRTRVSFDVGMRELGGSTIVLDNDDMQLGRGETIGDTARVLSRYVDAILLRAANHEALTELAENSDVPVINGLTDQNHPCQVMADVMTFEEHRGPIAGRIVAWCGDGNNMAATWVQAAAHFSFDLRVACPEELSPLQTDLDRARDNGARILVTRDPLEAVTGADCVVTDTWVSMNSVGRDADRRDLLTPFCVDENLIAQASEDAVFMHCLPAHRGEEVTDAVIDGPHSVVWDEAENRLHVQKGILAWCLRAL
tara:strand:- start:1004 stop:1939 length:936 start_codon:yes stop_codon:yes gene_type:complete